MKLEFEVWNDILSEFDSSRFTTSSDEETWIVSKDDVKFISVWISNDNAVTWIFKVDDTLIVGNPQFLKFTFDPNSDLTIQTITFPIQIIVAGKEENGIGQIENNTMKFFKSNGLTWQENCSTSICFKTFGQNN